jgi:hypothetical protein
MIFETQVPIFSRMKTILVTMQDEKKIPFQVTDEMAVLLASPQTGTKIK